MAGYFYKGCLQRVGVAGFEVLSVSKGMEIFAWCIMTNQVHFVFRTREDSRPEMVLCDFKRFTGRAMVEGHCIKPAVKP